MKKKPVECCKADDTFANAECTVDSIISVDERGQMVLPKELRERAGIVAGDKLAVASWTKDGRVCCITLMRTDDLLEIMKDRIGPVIKEAIANGKR